MSKSGKTVRLLQVTDPHLYAVTGTRLLGVDTHASLLAVVNNAKSHHWPPDAILATGDLVQDESREGYQHFRRVFEALSVPVYAIPGNHDDPVFMQQVLEGGRFRYCETAVFDDWSVPTLSTYAKGQAGGVLSHETLWDLEQTLGRHRDKYALICLHHQPVPMGSRWLDAVGLADAKDFLAVIARHDNVRGVLWGHVHQVFDEHRDGVRFMSTPSTCAQFLPGSEKFAVDTRPPGYRWLELKPDGSIDSEVVWLEGYTA